MLIRSLKPWQLKESDVTSERLFNQRRQFMKKGVYAGGALAALSVMPTTAMAMLSDYAQRMASAPNRINIDEKMNTFEEITGYNNFYELGTRKTDPVRKADALTAQPWTVTVEGHCDKPGQYNLEDLFSPAEFEERIYRLRCVEAWSMVIPWVGFSLASMLQRFEPNSKAKYVAFETLYEKDRPLPGQRFDVINWPYREGLRMDEAMHPLTFIATGVYGKLLPNQNGAPLRLIVPWKYGFKSIKSITKIRFSETQPETSWSQLAPEEYGFYANVNPKVNHPRWSQARERRIGEYYKRDTEMFNGYGNEVASLYQGLDLAANY